MEDAAELADRKFHTIVMLGHAGIGYSETEPIREAQSSIEVAAALKTYEQQVRENIANQATRNEQAARQLLEMIEGIPG